MITLIDSMLLAILLTAPFIPVLYVLMLVVADSIITTVKNWND